MESRLKRGYLRREGDMLEHMRKSNPKVFYKYFKKKQPKQTMITNDAFFLTVQGVSKLEGSKTRNRT